jgi:glyoxylase-like metal-dependent hydrolase (beta-lactamase superfamily II)
MKVYVVPVTAYQQNCSLLVCEQTNKAAIVDPGGEPELILRQVADVNADVEKILLTHGHFDHAGGAVDLAEQLGVPIEGPHRDDAFLLQGLPEWSAQFNLPKTRSCTPDRWLEEGDTVRFGAQVLQVLHCPGHTPGHLVLFHAQDRIALVGDVLFQGSIGRTDFPRGDHDTLLASIRQKLWPLGDDVRFLPGHGPTSTFGQERRNNPFVRDR